MTDAVTSPAPTGPDLVALDPVTSSEMIAARRGREMTAAELSATAGVGSAVVTSAERGEPVPREELAAVVGALGMHAPAVLGGLPHGPVRVPAADPEHARVMTFLGDAADVTDGWLMFPDYPEMRLEGPSDDEIAGIERARDGWRHWTRRTREVLVSLCGGSAITCVLVGLGSIMAGADGGSPCDPRSWTWFDHVVVWSALAFVVLLVAAGATFILGPGENPHDGPLGAARTRANLAADLARSLRRMRRTAFAVSRGGVTSYAVSRGDLERKEYLASSIRTVAVEEHGHGHVTLTLDTLLGRLVMPRLPRTRDLMDLVEVWRARAAEASCILDGPQ